MSPSPDSAEELAAIAERIERGQDPYVVPEELVVEP